MIFPAPFKVFGSIFARCCRYEGVWSPLRFMFAYGYGSGESDRRIPGLVVSDFFGLLVMRGVCIIALVDHCIKSFSWWNGWSLIKSRGICILEALHPVLIVTEMGEVASGLSNGKCIRAFQRPPLKLQVGFGKPSGKLYRYHSGWCFDGFLPEFHHDTPCGEKKQNISGFVLLTFTEI